MQSAYRRTLRMPAQKMPGISNNSRLTLAKHQYYLLANFTSEFYDWNDSWLVGTGRPTCHAFSARSLPVSGILSRDFMTIGLPHSPFSSQRPHSGWSHLHGSLVSDIIAGVSKGGFDVAWRLNGFSQAVGLNQGAIFEACDPTLSRF